MPRAKPRMRTRTGRIAYELHAEAQRLRVDFLNTDMDIVFTFLKLARLEHGAGDREHLDNLIKLTHDAVHTVEKLAQGLPAAKARPILRRLVKLGADLRETEAGARSDGRRFAGPA